MDSAIGLPILISIFGIGLLAGSVLRLVLNQFKHWVARLEGRHAKGFSNTAFWIVAGWVLLASYLLYVRSSPVGARLQWVGALYLGAVLPFAAQAGLFGWIRRVLRGSSPARPSEPPAFRPLTPFERWFLSSRSLSHLAMLAWCIALCLPVFADSPLKYSYGAQVLVGGWMGALTLQFAWFANPLLLIAYVRLQNGYGAMTYTAIALALSLETFVSFPSIGAYGYGWGMVLWFISLALMLAAAGAHELRSGVRPTFENRGWVRTFGIALAAGIAAVTIALSVFDRWGANQAETARMAKVAIKRGPVCRLEPAAITSLTAPLAGPLEVKPLSPGSPARFNERELLHNLMSWGIPALRLDGRDFFYMRSDQETLLSSLPAQGPAGATLELGGNREAVHLRLLDDRQRLLLDQQWFSQNKGQNYCPEYFPNPTSVQSPRASISAALGIAAPSTENRQTVTSTRLVGEIIGRSQGSPGKPLRIRNAHCAQDTGWRESEPLSAVLTSTRSRGFWIGEQAFYPSSQFYGKALCQGDSIFLYDASLPSATTSLTIEKRQRAGFKLVGNTVITLKDAAITGERLQLESVEESSQGLIIELSSPSSGLSFRVRAGVGF